MKNIRKSILPSLSSNFDLIEQKVYQPKTNLLLGLGITQVLKHGLKICFHPNTQELDNSRKRLEILQICVMFRCIAE